MWGDLELGSRWPRLVTLALGLWLVASSLVPPVESTSGFNQLIVGTAVACCSLMALWATWFRFWNTFFGVWLGATELLFEHQATGKFLATLAVAGAIVVLSLVPTPDRLVNPRRRPVTQRA
jgi:hypothetical protein